MHVSPTAGRSTACRPHALVTASSAAVALAASLVLVAPVASASTTEPNQPQVHVDHVYGDGATTSPTADKPQSKLWWNDGSWWALMATTSEVTIHELRDDTWVDTGVVVDPRIDSNGDALFSGGQLYVASRAEDDPQTNAPRDTLVSRYTYSSANRTYDLVGDSRTVVPGADGVESVSMDRDSDKRLWLTYTKDAKVWVTHTDAPDSLAFVLPFQIPGADTDVSTDDISAVISLGNQIGVMWSDTSDAANGAMRFAVRDDTAPADGTWQEEVALPGPYGGDDHINLKSMLGDDQGRVHAAVKTSEDNNPDTDGTAASIVVLTRTTDGKWTSATAATVADGQTRPQLALDSTNRELYVLQSDVGGGSVHYKTTSLDRIEFPDGKGAPFIAFPGNSINNVSTAKDPVTAETGLVAIATDTTARQYFHAQLAIDGEVTQPPADTTPPPAPVFSPAGGEFTSEQSVELSTTEVDAVIRYEVGTGTEAPDPTVDSTVYSGPITVSASSLIKARAFDAAGNASPVVGAKFTITKPTPPAPAPSNVLAAGKQLTSGQSLTSPNGKYRLAMQGDGNVVVYAGSSRVLWHAGTSRNPGARLVMQTDGNLVAYSATNRPLWYTGTRGAARLVLQDDGNLVVYRTTDNRPLWNTGADKPAPAPVERTSTLTAGSRLVAGQQLTSSDGRYRFVMQGDGNAVVYRDSRPVWFSGTGGRPGARLVLQGDGNLVLYASNGAPLWHTRTSTGTRLVMQTDGNLVLYRADGRPVWFTGADRG